MHDNVLSDSVFAPNQTLEQIYNKTRHYLKSKEGFWTKKGGNLYNCRILREIPYSTIYFRYHIERGYTFMVINSVIILNFHENAEGITIDITVEALDREKHESLLSPVVPELVTYPETSIERERIYIAEFLSDYYTQIGVTLSPKHRTLLFPPESLEAKIKRENERSNESLRTYAFFIGWALFVLLLLSL